MLASMQTTDKDLVGATEATEILGVGKDTLIRMIARGVITPRQKLPGPNGAWLFTRAEVQRVAAERDKAS